MASISIGSFSIAEANYTAQPYGHEESDIKLGRTARKWDVSLLLTREQWASLNSAYLTWRNARINDPDTLVSGTVGTTVAFSATGAGQSYSTSCWFISAPSGSDIGNQYVEANVGLVDAAEALQVFLKEQEKPPKPALGTINVGGVTLTLLNVPDTYEDPPTILRTASGKDWVEGPLRAARKRKIVGTTDSAGWSGIKTWFEATVNVVPSSGAWYPSSAPTAEAEIVVESGVVLTKYTVTLEQRQII
jgi:hypothetical protein